MWVGHVWAKIVGPHPKNLGTKLHGYMASVSSLKSLNGERRGKDIFISYGREEGVKVSLRGEHNNRLTVRLTVLTQAVFCYNLVCPSVLNK